MPLKDPIKRKEYQNQYYHKNKNALEIQKKLWRKNNRLKTNEINRLSYQRHKQKILNKHKEWREQNPSYYKEYSELSDSYIYNRMKMLRRNYGLSLQDFENMLESQDFKCKICKK